MTHWIWCESCQDHFAVEHYDEEYCHRIGSEYGPTGRSIARERIHAAVLAEILRQAERPLSEPVDESEVLNRIAALAEEALRA